MQEDLLQVLCCPSCKGDLKLDVKRKQKEEIVEGTLTCKGCSAVYPIEHSIPNFLPSTEEKGPGSPRSKEVKAHA
jgi:uncharacterized protein YbaR (Trm112 family)